MKTTSLRAAAGGLTTLVLAAAALGQPQKLAPAQTTPAPAAPRSPASATPETKTPAAPAAPGTPAMTETAKDAAVLDFKVKTIDGTEQDLSAYKGKVVVIVNVASKCGFTSQYKGLEELYAKHKDEGLVVLGFPANNFGKQEPGTDAEIKEFCDATFHVTFPMFAKVSVKGDDVPPLYQKLEAQPKPIGGAPKWNFTKFVVDRKGNVVARFDADKLLAGTPNLEPALVKKVEEELMKNSDAAKQPGSETGKK